MMNIKNLKTQTGYKSNEIISILTQIFFWKKNKVFFARRYGVESKPKSKM